ncbi:MAG: PhzF family phenazine biosynthesis protein [Armatimonadetes bacterium]|nr:PhzF family phenazine biosynthesis protein [Armatimonadota bacterium]
MRIPFFQVDAFADAPFGGNPAAIVVMEQFPEDRVMQSIAAENNLAETAFLVQKGEETQLRWFTPVLEVPLCGHGTLATAAVVMEKLKPGANEVVFQTKSGPLPVKREGVGYAMNFPARPCTETAVWPELTLALGVEPQAVYQNTFNYMAILDTAEAVRGLRPNLDLVAKLDRPGVIVTAPGSGEWDFVSRYFAPQKGIPEDPVTGAAHCMLTPYWANVLGRTSLVGYQASKRGGTVLCELHGDRVVLKGKCAFVIEGHMTI